MIIIKEDIIFQETHETDQIHDITMIITIIIIVEVGIEELDTNNHEIIDDFQEDHHTKLLMKDNKHDPKNATGAWKENHEKDTAVKNVAVVENHVIKDVTEAPVAKADHEVETVVQVNEYFQ